MSQTEVQPRTLVPGTSGWTASDLDDPEIARQWDAGRFEIVHGILKTMPPADFDHGEAVFELLSLTRDHFRRQGQKVRVSTEVDLIVSEDDVLRVDGMLFTAGNIEAQRQVLVELGRDAGRVGRVRVAPLLVIESVSRGHERHDWRTKRALYAGFRIPNYWIVDALRRTLDCLVLRDGAYTTDASGRDFDVVCPTAFAGLQILLTSLWGEAADGST